MITMITVITVIKVIKNASNAKNSFNIIFDRGFCAPKLILTNCIKCKTNIIAQVNIAVLHEKANSAIIRNAISIILTIFPKKPLQSYKRKTAKQEVNPKPICKGSAPLENRNLPTNRLSPVKRTYVIKNIIIVETIKLTFITLVHLQHFGFEANAVIKASEKRIYAISEVKFPATKECL